ncbi:ABC transporter permease [Granulicella cerasi]|uniref:ABC transporter permease n=1 Tax=Granulicella cerasi TaxID=741063 RepID=A0ABW1Z849_9BACT|nr:ABC transporter permease [Granulicella cerasi]
MRNIWLVAKREYLERVRAKSFVVMTVLIPALMAGVIGGLVLVNKNQHSAQHVAIITDDAKFAANVQSELNESKSFGAAPKVDVYPLADTTVRTKLDAELKQKGSDLDGYLVVTPAADPTARPTFQWVPRVQSDVITRGRVSDAARGGLVRAKLLAAGMSEVQVDGLLAPVKLDNGKDGDGRAGAAVASAWGMYFLMYFIILFYGMNVARSIIEEKTSRVFEVMLASIKPDEMLAGKVLGVGAVGLTQVGIWIAVAVVIVKFQTMALDLHILPSAPQAALFVVFFLLGYLLYSSLAAALGAMNNSEQELQQMQIFLMLPLICSSFIIFNVITAPDGPVAKFASFFPFTTPLIMYTRVIVGKPGGTAIAASIAGLVVTIAIVLWLASRIYRVGILMYGKKPNLPEILRWLKYS